MNFVKSFSASIEMIMWYLFFSLLMCCVTLIDLQILKNPCILGINPTWSWCVILLMYCCIWIASICWVFLCLCSSVILACNFHFLWYLWIWYQGDGGFIEWNLEVFLPLKSLEQFQKDRCYFFSKCLIEFTCETI